MSRLILALLAAFYVLTGAAFAETRFLSALDDVPLPAGFSETEGGFVFEGPEGRLIEARARGPASAEDCRDFFEETLPALGWAASPRANDALAFRRGRERLSVQVAEAGGAREIVVRLVTQPASMAPD